MNYRGIHDRRYVFEGTYDLLHMNTVLLSVTYAFYLFKLKQTFDEMRFICNDT